MNYSVYCMKIFPHELTQIAVNDAKNAKKITAPSSARLLLWPYITK